MLLKTILVFDNLFEGKAHGIKMKIIIAPDSFKESLSSVEVAQTIHHAFQIALHSAELVSIPMGDGGEGTLAALAEALPITQHPVEVTGPMFEPRTARFGVLSLDVKQVNVLFSDIWQSDVLHPDASQPKVSQSDVSHQEDIAIIEMAQASGLKLVPKHERNPLYSTSFGTGELILNAVKKGYKRLIIGLGGSATCDGGMGALSAFGVEFFDITGKPLKPIGANLSKIEHIELSNLNPMIADCEFLLAHDVNNHLLGLEGALMYAPQKGASPKDIELLHKGLENFSFQISRSTQKQIGELPGTGAAGGLASGLFAFCNARLVPGASLMMELVGFSQKLENADLVITGEGQLDSQSLHGKTPIAIAKLAKEKNIPVIAFAANLKGDLEELYRQGILAVFSIVPGPVSEEMSIKLAKPWLCHAAYNIARLLKLKK